jgi:hypothetical protein
MQPDTYECAIVFGCKQVRFEMAKVLNVPETEHTHGDLMLAVKAQQLKMVCTPPVVTK